MLSTAGAEVIVAVALIFAAILGLLAGVVIRLAVRRRLAGVALFADAVVSAIVFLGVDYLHGRVEVMRGNWGYSMWPAYAIAVASVILRNLLFAPRKPSIQPANLK